MDTKFHFAHLLSKALAAPKVKAKPKRTAKPKPKPKAKEFSFADRVKREPDVAALWLKVLKRVNERLREQE